MYNVLCSIHIHIMVILIKAAVLFYFMFEATRIPLVEARYIH